MGAGTAPRACGGRRNAPCSTGRVVPRLARIGTLVLVIGRALVASVDVAVLATSEPVGDPTFETEPGPGAIAFGSDYAASFAATEGTLAAGYPMFGPPFANPFALLLEIVPAAGATTLRLDHHLWCNDATVVPPRTVLVSDYGAVAELAVAYSVDGSTVSSRAPLPTGRPGWRSRTIAASGPRITIARYP
jgi:hypothetical protein